MWQFFVVFLTSSVKFLFAPIAALKLGFTWWETILITSAGGMFGVMVFYSISAWLMKRAAAAKKLSSKTAKNFTRVNKSIVKVKRAFGQFGIIYFTLPFVSIPVCAIISYKFFKHKKSTLFLLFSSVVIWSFLLTAFYSVF